MKLYFTTFFLVSTFLFNIAAKAETLLIPDSTVTFESYQIKCKEAGYLCTPKYFLESIVQKPTPQFTKFIDSIDLSNKLFLDSAAKTIQGILQSEMISPIQLDMLLRLLQQINSSGTTTKNKELVTELQLILSTVNSSNKIFPSDPEFISFFKTTFTKSQFAKIKSSYLKLPYAEISFNHDLKIAFTNSDNQVNGFNLVEGTCEQSRLVMEIEPVSWKILSNNFCGWAKNIQQASTSTFSTIKENKGWLLVGGLVLGAVLLSRQYEVQLQF